MFISKKGTSILIFFILSFVFGCAKNNGQWNIFLKNPNAESFAILNQFIDANEQICIRGKQTNRTIISYNNNRPLFELINKGNVFSFKIGLLIEKCFDGGELGDFYKNSGLFFDNYPSKFSDIIKEFSVYPEIVSDIILSLPNNSTDQFDLQLSIVEQRINSLEELNGERLFEIKKQLIIQLKKKRKFMIENKNLL